MPKCMNCKGKKVTKAVESFTEKRGPTFITRTIEVSRCHLCGVRYIPKKKYDKAMSKRGKANKTFGKGYDTDKRRI